LYFICTITFYLCPICKKYLPVGPTHFFSVFLLLSFKFIPFTVSLVSCLSARWLLLTRMQHRPGQLVIVACLGTPKTGTCCSPTPLPKLGHHLITFYLANSTATTLLHFSYLHMSHVSSPFGPPLFNIVIKLCCNVQSVNSKCNLVHPLLLAPSASVSFTVNHLLSFKRLPVRIYRNAD